MQEGTLHIQVSEAYLNEGAFVFAAANPNEL